MGYAAVALLAATGAINTLLLVGNVDSLAGTPYGRLLSLKILLFPVMVVLALINRFRLLPRLRREPATARKSRSSACAGRSRIMRTADPTRLTRVECPQSGAREYGVA